MGRSSRKSGKRSPPLAVDVDIACAAKVRQSESNKLPGEGRIWKRACVMRDSREKARIENRCVGGAKLVLVATRVVVAERAAFGDWEVDWTSLLAET